ncbi:MAG: hypothetical protein AABX93_01520 [Nanoarchaeota archaeon]
MANHYRISVVKTDGGYLVNHYSKRADDFLPTFADVVNRLFEYNSFNLGEQSPTLIGLSESEIKAVRNIRDSKLERANSAFAIEDLKDMMKPGRPSGIH